jgi:hypothetical protein
MNVFQKYTVATTISVVLPFIALYFLVNQRFVPFFVTVAIGLITSLIRMYYKTERLKTINADKVAIETLSSLGKHKKQP